MKFLDYIKGRRKGKDAHRIEYDAMSDPFLADAIEGYDSVEGNHTDSIARMQARIAAKTNYRKGRSGAWKVAVAAVAVIAAVSGYFSLMNHKSSMATASCDNCFIDIYAPEDYIERKRLELTLMQEQSPTIEVAATAIVNIENLKDIIKPVERISVYLPQSYAQMKNNDLAELAHYESKRSSRKELSADLPSSEAEEEERDVASESEKKMKSKNISAYFANSQSSFRIVGDVSYDMLDSIQDDSPLLAFEETAKNALDEKSNAGSISRASALSTRDKDDNNKLESTRKPLSQPSPKGEASSSSAKKRQISGSGSFEESLMGKSSVLYGASGASLAKDKISVETLAFSAIPYPLIGHEKYKEYLKTSLVRPIGGECADKKGVVIVEFSIGQDGRPQNIQVLKSLCKESDKEAVRLIKSGSDWTLGTGKVQVEVHF